MTDAPNGSPPRKTERNWAIWRDRRAGGMLLKDIAASHGMSLARVRLIISQYERAASNALSSTDATPDEVRQAVLGVEFVFAHELVIDPIADGWRCLGRPRKEGEPTATDRGIRYHIKRQGD
jgi:hypothetical protein